MPNHSKYLAHTAHMHLILCFCVNHFCYFLILIDYFFFRINSPLSIVYAVCARCTLRMCYVITAKTACCKRGQFVKNLLCYYIDLYFKKGFLQKKMGLGSNLVLMSHPIFLTSNLLGFNL